MARLACVLLFAGCSFPFRELASKDARGKDGGVDAIDGGANCFGTGLGVQVCLKTLPTAPYAVGNSIISVDTDGTCTPLVGATANDYCVLVGTSVMINGGIVAHGSRPLVIVSLSTIRVSKAIDVASHRNGTIGAAADWPQCGGTPATGATGGGFGGSFGAHGGNGGVVPPGGVAGGAIAPTTLHGGCRGGVGVDATTNGVGGHSGGAIDLIAETSITLDSTIDASGEGGGGAGPTSNGGGGGGSGGLIVFDTPSLMFGTNAVIYANGGGGGGGSDITAFTASNGGDPLGPNVGGGGGGGQGTGGDGGDGGYGTTSATSGKTSGVGSGAGGGGGSVGVIKVFRAPVPTSGVVSPPIS